MQFTLVRMEESDIERQRAELKLKKEMVAIREKDIALRERELDLTAKEERNREIARKAKLDALFTVAKILSEFWAVIAGALVLLAGIFLVINRSTEDNDIGMMLLGAGTGTAGTGVVAAQRSRSKETSALNSERQSVKEEKDG